jgi:hypothetical protein
MALRDGYPACGPGGHFACPPRAQEVRLEKRTGEKLTMCEEDHRITARKDLP